MERLDFEQDSIIKAILKLAYNETCEESSGGISIVDKALPNKSGLLVDEFCETWSRIQSVLKKVLPQEAGLSLIISNVLRQLLPVFPDTKDIRKLLGSILTLSPTLS